MANPLQPKVIKILERDYNAFVVNVVSSSKAGIMDVIACIPRTCQGEFGAETEGLFYGFEVKWGKDVPSELQKQKINSLIDSGGRGYFIRSTSQLIHILENDITPMKYPLQTKLLL